MNQNNEINVIVFSRFLSLRLGRSYVGTFLGATGSLFGKEALPWRFRALKLSTNKPRNSRCNNAVTKTTPHPLSFLIWWSSSISSSSTLLLALRRHPYKLWLIVRKSCTSKGEINLWWYAAYLTTQIVHWPWPVNMRVHHFAIQPAIHQHSGRSMLWNAQQVNQTLSAILALCIQIAVFKILHRFFNNPNVHLTSSRKVNTTLSIRYPQ